MAARIVQEITASEPMDIDHLHAHKRGIQRRIVKDQLDTVKAKQEASKELIAQSALLTAENAHRAVEMKARALDLGIQGREILEKVMGKLNEFVNGEEDGDDPDGQKSGPGRLRFEVSMTKKVFEAAKNYNEWLDGCVGVEIPGQKGTIIAKNAVIGGSHTFTGDPDADMARFASAEVVEQEDDE